MIVVEKFHNQTAPNSQVNDRLCEPTYGRCGKQQIEDGLYWLGIMALVSWIFVIIYLTKDYWFGDARCVYCGQNCRNKCNAQLIHQMAHRRPESHWLVEWQSRRQLTLAALRAQRTAKDPDESLESDVLIQ
uniref:C2H2-type domain-containing protein n=1 Tax=Plectus sambesii TaxID=2011161 RepID=A0A914X7R1_9BILA